MQLVQQISKLLMSGIIFAASTAFALEKKTMQKMLQIERLTDLKVG